MAKQTLAGKPHLAVSLDGNGGGLRGLLLGLSELYVHGVEFDVARLFDGRDITLVEIAQLAVRAAPPVLAKHYWMVSGG